MATTKVTPFVVPEQDSPDLESWIRRTIAQKEAELTGHAVELDAVDAKLLDATRTWRSAKCYGCRETFSRRVDADIHRRDSVGCHDGEDGALVVDFYGPCQVN